MKKILKKYLNINLIIGLLLVSIIIPNPTHSKTLGDLKEELQQNINEYNTAKQEKQLTQSQMEQINNNIVSATTQIQTSQTEIKELNDDIEQLEKDIEIKNQQIKDIISFYQLSGSSTAYLEYAMGAQDFTDFIYRMAITEQLLGYNDQLVTEYNQMIIDNQNKQVELNEKISSLEKKQETLSTQLNSLGSKMNEIVDLTVDIEEEIKTRKEAISMYEKQYGCKDTDDINVCTRGQLPADTKFWRPIISGGITSRYGARSYVLNGKRVTDFHSGMDLVGTTDVYSAAAGVVAAVVRKSSCGGNKIYIHHKINGVTYTTSYVHLAEILVNVGDVVTKDTKVGIMGGRPNVETWDKCSTGRHLHFAIAYGLYLTDYTSWNTYISKTVNPMTLVNFPSTGSFANRTTKY